MSEDRFRAMVMAMGVGILETDRTGRLTFMNPVAEAHLRWTESELRDHNLNEILLHRDANDHLWAFWDSPMLNAIRAGQPYRADDEGFVCKDGSVVGLSVVAEPIQKAGAISGYVIAVLDVTVRPGQEFSAPDSPYPHPGASLDRRRLEAVLDTLPAAVLLVVPGSATVAWANRAAERLLRVPREQIPVAPSPPAGYDLRRSDGVAYTRESFPATRTLTYGEEVLGEEAMLVWSDDDTQHLLVNSIPLRDGRGQIAGAVVELEDITRLKEYERLREEFVSVIVHDLRAPLQVISGYAQFLETLPGVQLGSRREQQAVAAINTSALRLSRMVTDLLDASRIVARRLRIERSDVALPPLVREAIAQLANLLQEHPVRIDVRGEIPLVAADASRIEQVLTNLLTNAAKYSPAGAPIEIVVEPVDREVLVSVCDHGIGIARWEIPYLFDRFYRSGAALRTEQDGLGVGLYIVRGLVEAHGGRTWVESQEGRGSTFTFTLPVSAAMRSDTITIGCQPMTDC